MRAVLLLAATLPLLAACGPGAERGPRLLVVGWDGASFREIDRLLAEGRLPTVASLLARGSSARLASTMIPISSAAWTSAVTGKGPGETGVYTFFEPVEGTYDVRLVSSRSNHAPPLWRILTARGVRSLVVGVPLTYPPEPILGTMVTGMLSPFDATYTYPADLTRELRSRGFTPDLGPWYQSRSFGWPEVAEHLDVKEEVLGDLIAEDWRFSMIVFKSLDELAHRTFRVDFEDAISPAYERLDAILGGLLEAVGPDTNVLLVSDHGFYPYPFGFNLHAWLVERGFSVRKEKVLRFHVDDTEPLATRERQVVRQLRNELDWSRTRAFSYATEGNFGAVRLNVVGREPEGCVEPEDVESVLAELGTELRSLQDMEGRSLVVAIHRGAELYPGRFGRELIPDLVFELVEDCQAFSDPEEPQILGPYGVLVPDHAREGILIAAGPSFAARPGRGDAAIADVAPTALHLLSQPVYREMTGRVLAELLSDPAPPRLLSEPEDELLRAAPAAGEEPFTEAQLEELTERLRTLGYTE